MWRARESVSMLMLRSFVFIHHFFPARRLSPPLVTLFVSWLHLDPGQNQLFEAFCTRTRGRKGLAEGRRGENKQQQRKKKGMRLWIVGTVGLILNVGRRWIRSSDVKSLKMCEWQRAGFMEDALSSLGENRALDQFAVLNKFRRRDQAGRGSWGFEPVHSCVPCADSHGYHWCARQGLSEYTPTMWVVLTTPSL